MEVGGGKLVFPLGRAENSIGDVTGIREIGETRQGQKMNSGFVDLFTGITYLSPGMAPAAGIERAEI